MDDDELTRIRQQRLAQLQASHGGGGQTGGVGRPATAGQQLSRGDNGDEKQKQERQAKEAEMRNNILSAVLTQEARARLATLGAVKPDRARMVEDIIIQNTRMGGIRGKVDEASLKDLLERVNTQTKRETKVRYERRRVFDDDDDDDDD